jgi:hypothetical protein
MPQPASVRSTEYKHIRTRKPAQRLQTKPNKFFALPRTKQKKKFNDGRFDLF